MNCIDLYSVLQYPRYLENHMVPFFQFTSGLCSTSQLCPRNRSVSLISNTTVLICLMCLFEFNSKSTNSLIVFSLFFDLSELYISKDFLGIFVSIFFSFTISLVIVVCIYSESINALTLSFLPLLILIVGCTMSFLDCSLF